MTVPGRCRRYLGDLNAERILSGLNPEQRAAVEATRGPVVHPRRRGDREDDDDHAPDRVAGGERRVPAWADRGGDVHRQGGGRAPRAAAALGTDGVRASTFHSAALALLRHFEGDPGRILPSKAPLLRRIGNSLPRPFRFRPAGDLATEIEWAKNRRLTPAHVPRLARRPRAADPARPLAPGLPGVRAAQGRRGALDFEDLLERAARLLEGDEGVRAAVHDRWRAFTVDEYQDVNLLQQSLLDLWLGDRDDLCAVGDDYQAIYGFTGASAEWLLALPRRFPTLTSCGSSSSYRSTPQVIELANRLVPRLGGSAKTLAPTLPDGPEPVVGPAAARR